MQGPHPGLFHDIPFFVAHDRQPPIRQRGNVRVEVEIEALLPEPAESFLGWPHAGHITLLRGERSRLADHASEAL